MRGASWFMGTSATVGQLELPRCVELDILQDSSSTAASRTRSTWAERNWNVSTWNYTEHISCAAAGRGGTSTQYVTNATGLVLCPFTCLNRGTGVTRNCFWPSSLPLERTGCSNRFGVAACYTQTLLHRVSQHPPSRTSYNTLGSVRTCRREHLRSQGSFPINPSRPHLTGSFFFHRCRSVIVFKSRTGQRASGRGSVLFRSPPSSPPSATTFYITSWKRGGGPREQQMGSQADPIYPERAHRRRVVWATLFHLPDLISCRLSLSSLSPLRMNSPSTIDSTRSRKKNT